MNIEPNIDKSMFFDNIKSNNFYISKKKIMPLYFYAKNFASHPNFLCFRIFGEILKKFSVTMLNIYIIYY